MLVGMCYKVGFPLGGPHEGLPLEKKLELAKARGYDGVYFITPTLLSTKLDGAELDHYKQVMDELDLFLEVGIGRLNPYNTTETPWVWDLTGGDYLRGMEMQVEAAARLGCRNLTACAAGAQYRRSGYHAVDRYRTDVSWPDQLAATEKFIRLLLPVLRDTGCKVALETHEELTSFEVLRFLQAIGPDYMSVTFDNSNAIRNGEDPVCAAKRVAPYVSLAHFRDSVPFFTDRGIAIQIRGAGEGFVDFEAILRAFMAQNRDVHIMVEEFFGTQDIYLYEERFIKAHPDVDPAETMGLVRHTVRCAERVAAGEIPGRGEYPSAGPDEDRQRRADASAQYYKALIARIAGEGQNHG